MKTSAVAKQPYGIVLAQWADGEFISTSDTFLLEKDEGAGWVTVPSTEYALHASIGEIVKRDYDSSAGTEVAWSASASFRCTYTVINSTTLAENTYTQEAQTADYLDEFVAGDDEGELNASAPRDLIVQEIHAGRGVVGKWVINKQYLARDTGTDATSAGMAPLDYPFYAGATYANRASANFRVTPAGDVTMAGSLSVGGSVTVGGTITVSGTIKSDDYVANSIGWKIAGSGFAEFKNLIVRGEFHAGVFVKGLIKATAGSEIIAKSAGVVKTAFTTQTSPTTFNVDVKDPPTGHAQLFDVGDILRAKDEAGSDVWFTVGSVSDQTTFYRYVCTKNNGANATFQPGVTIIDYGASGQGFLYLTADDSDGPFYSVRTHAGSPWSATTERGRFGNMKNAFGTGASNYYGFGVGDYSGGNYIKYDSNGGFALKAGGNSVTLDGDGIGIVTGTSQPNKIGWDTAAPFVNSTLFVSQDATDTKFLSEINIDTQSANGYLYFNTLSNSVQNAKFWLGAVGGVAGYAGFGSSSFVGLLIAEASGLDYTDAPSSLLHLKSTAPAIRMEDTTGSASSLLVTTNANKTIFKEVSGSDLFVLDLANSRVGIFNASPTVALDVTGAGLFSGALTAQGAFTSLGIDDNADAVAITIDSSERVLIGRTSTTNYGGSNYKVKVFSATTNAAGVGGISLAQYSADTRAPDLVFGKSRGGDVDTLTVVNSGDVLGRIIFTGADGNTFDVGARIQALVDGTPGDGDMPGRIELATTADGASSPTTRLTIYSTGRALFANEIELDGDLNHDGTNVGFYGVTPVARPGAITQTYSTTATTITQTTMTDPAAYGAGANGYSTGAMASAIHAEVIALRANMIVTQNVLNYVIDSLQSQGLLQ